jgi:DMSO/TMAO reductase YedYZ heme-binding membrane subunit
MNRRTTYMNKNFTLYIKAFGIWLILAVGAIIVAIFRNGVILPLFGEQTAHQIGTLIFLIVQFAIIYFFIKQNNLMGIRTALSIGIFWLILTIIFEFLFGHYVMGHSWEKLFADYNIFKGRLWILVLINNVAAPVLSSRLIRK